MRKLSLSLALLIATPLAAQTSLEQLQQMVTTDTANAGFPQAVAATIATCFTSRMSEEEAALVLASEDLEGQQQALAGMAQYDLALACVAEAM